MSFHERYQYYKDRYMTQPVFENHLFGIVRAIVSVQLPLDGGNSYFDVASCYISRFKAVNPKT